jgi:hypothetical protein
MRSLAGRARSLTAKKQSPLSGASFFEPPQAYCLAGAAGALALGIGFAGDAGVVPGVAAPEPVVSAGALVVVAGVFIAVSEFRVVAKATKPTTMHTAIRPAIHIPVLLRMGSATVWRRLILGSSV